MHKTPAGLFGQMPFCLFWPNRRQVNTSVSWQQLQPQIQAEHPFQAQRVDLTQLGYALQSIAQAVAVDAQGIGTGLALAVMGTPGAQGSE